MYKLPKDFDYNSIPVYYCTQCLSLRIMGVQGVATTEFCDNCNSTSISQANIFDWEKLYEEKYGFNYLNGKKNGRD